MAKKNRHRGKFQYNNPIKKVSELMSTANEQDEEKRAWEQLVGKKYIKGVEND